MAENVQSNIEEMIPEIEELERIGFFTDLQTRQIMKKRVFYEYRLCRRHKSKQTYMGYIQYESNILDLISTKRKESGYKHKYAEIDHKIKKRINNLFEYAEDRFKGDQNIWLTHIDFCRHNGDTAVTGHTFTRMLKVLNNKPGLWVLAAKFEFEENDSMDNSRAMLLRGIRYNNNSKELWSEYFRMELLNCEVLNKRMKLISGDKDNQKTEEEPVDPSILDGKIAMVVVDNALIQFPDDALFLANLLTISLQFENTKMHDFMYNELQFKFPNSPVAWKAKAERKLHQVLTLTDINANKNLDEMAYSLFASFTDANEREKVVEAKKYCLKIYEEAVATLPMSEMYDLYINTMFKYFTSEEEEIVDVMQRAFNIEALSVESALKWVKMENVDHRHILSIDLFHRYLYSYEMLAIYLPVQMQHSSDGMPKCFQAVNEAIANKQNLNDQDLVKMWEVAFEFFFRYSKHYITKLFKLAKKSDKSSVYAYAKVPYLKFIYDHNGLDAAREKYSQLLDFPVNIDFFNLYIAIENNQNRVNDSRISRAYEVAVFKIGAENPDLWIDYLRFTMKTSADPEVTSNIMFRAKKYLPVHLHEEFTLKYSLMRNAGEAPSGEDDDNDAIGMDD